jgi:outer membrane protein TolC
VELEKVAIENLERTENHHHLTEERHTVGDVPLADVYRAQVEVAQAKQGLVKTKNRVRISRVNLNSAMGLPPDLEVAIASPMQEPATPQDSELHAAQSNSTYYRPELRKMQREIDALAFKVKEAQGACGPKFAAEGGYGKRDSDWFPQTEEWLVGVKVDVPLFTGYALTHNLRRARAELCQAKAQYDRIRLDVQQEVWTAYSRLVEAYETIETSIAQVKDAQESLRLTTERYKAGAGIISDLLDAQTALTRAEATQVDALWSFQSAKTYFIWTQGLLNLGQE